MSKAYNIVERLKNENMRPTIQIDENHEYKINTSKNAALLIKCISQDEKLDDFDRIDKIIECALGEEALEYINSLDLTMNALTTVINVIMAGIGGVDLEEMDEMSEKEARKFRKGK